MIVDDCLRTCVETAYFMKIFRLSHLKNTEISSYITFLNDSKLFGKFNIYNLELSYHLICRKINIKTTTDACIRI